MPEPSLRPRGMATRYARRLLAALRDFRDVRRRSGIAHAISEGGADFRMHVSERLIWLLARTDLRGGRAERLVGAAWPKPVVRGVLFLGYVEAGLGLGQSLRGLIEAVSATSIRIGIWPIELGVESRIIGPFMPQLYDLRGTYRINLIEMAVDQIPHLLNHVGSRKFDRSYNILRTYWELPRAPVAWAAHLALIDEIWAPTAFVAEALRPIFTGPILIVPPCVDVTQDPDGSDRATFGLDGNRFYFLFSFDFHSGSERKNPLAVLRAFQEAFPASPDGVGLVIKMTGPADDDPHVRDVLRRSAAADRRIVLIDATLSRARMLSLIRLCDCYVSLHRSEGFGLGMAEAMAFGKPVIGTDFSGSRDFLSPDTGFPVPYRPRTLIEGDYPCADGQTWAEPDERVAAEAMRTVYGERLLSGLKGGAARRFVNAHYSRTAIGRLAEERIKHLLEGPARDRRRPALSS